MTDTADFIHAEEIVKGDIVRLDVGWRHVLDVWEALGFVHVVASDGTGMWKRGEEVEVGRRPVGLRGKGMTVRMVQK